MRTLIRYSLQDLAAHWKLSLAMTLLIGASILFFLVISGYRLTLGREYAALPDVNLIVQESNTLGELYGSRIQAQVVEQLYALGVSQAIPEFHDTVGTSVDDMLMLRGVDPERYQTLDRLTLLSGQALQPGDPPRTAMLGRRLAEKLGVSAGQAALIRGRQFNVCGVFHTGTYADNEAWVSIADAQDLLGRKVLGKSPTAQRMLKYAFNLIDDGLVGQQVFAGVRESAAKPAGGLDLPIQTSEPRPRGALPRVRQCAGPLVIQWYGTVDLFPVLLFSVPSLTFSKQHYRYNGCLGRKFH